MVTFPAAGHLRPMTGTKLYCLVTEAHVCEQLAQESGTVKIGKSQFVTGVDGTVSANEP